MKDKIFDVKVTTYIVRSLNDSDIILLHDTDMAILIRKIDAWLSTTQKFSLMGELNIMQTQIGNCENSNNVFYSKFEIPLYFINLVLYKFNLKIEKE